MQERNLHRYVQDRNPITCPVFIFYFFRVIELYLLLPEKQINIAILTIEKVDDILFTKWMCLFRVYYYFISKSCVVLIKQMLLYQPIAL